MSAIDTVLGRMPDARKATDGGWQAKCPAHEDRRASLSISEGAEGRVVLHCHAGCDVREVVRCMELSLADLFPPKPEPATQRRIVATYPYTDESGALLFEVVRFEPKDFRQRHKGPDGAWVWKMNGVQRVPYRLPELRAACAAGGEVWIVEGEKDADTLHTHGLTATCNPQGAGKWRAEYGEAFKGASAAYIVPDNDAPGRAHADAVAAALVGTVPAVKVVPLPAAAKDVSEWLGYGATVVQLNELAARAPAFNNTKAPDAATETTTAPLSGFAQLLAQARTEVVAYASGAESAEHQTPAFEPAAALLTREFPPTPWLIRGLLVDESVSATAGEAKTTKTWAVCEKLMAVATGTPAFGHFPTGQPRHVALFLVEDDARSVRNRLRALAAGRDMSAEAAVARIFVKCRGRLDLLNDDDVAWVIASCRALPERPVALALDPLRDLHGAEEDKGDGMSPVMHRLRLLRDLLGCAILFVHHSAKASETTNARRPGQRMRGSGVIHASVDGGLYLSGLETDGAGKFENTADVELKAVRGAGQFSLCLDVTDDEDGEAIEARWTVTQTERAAAKVEDGDDLDRAQADALKVLKQEATAATLRGERPRPLAVEALAKKVSKAKHTITAALKQLQAEGTAEQAYRGKKAVGWVYCYTAAPIRSGFVPESPERSPDSFPPPIGGTDLGTERTPDDLGNEDRGPADA